LFNEAGGRNFAKNLRSAFADSRRCKNALVKEGLMLRALEVIGR